MDIIFNCLQPACCGVAELNGCLRLEMATPRCGLAVEMLRIMCAERNMAVVCFGIGALIDVEVE